MSTTINMDILHGESSTVFGGDGMCIITTIWITYLVMVLHDIFKKKEKKTYIHMVYIHTVDYFLLIVGHSM